MNTQAITAELAADIERAMRDTLAADTLPAERELARMAEIQAGLAALGGRPVMPLTAADYLVWFAYRSRAQEPGE